MKIFIIGMNGFIGSWLAKRLVQEKAVERITGIDIASHRIEPILNHEKIDFHTKDLFKEMTWIEEYIQQADCIVPLAAIANPSLYVTDPLRVFSLDFEANLEIIKRVAQYQKRLLFPSTSEVYGMCSDQEFDEDTSKLVLGPIQKQRWIYSCCKQLLDRLIYAYGQTHNLNYTIFRPFNWMGPEMDDIYNSKRGASRAIPQFFHAALFGKTIHLVNEGIQKRCFLYVEDAIDALWKILLNPETCYQQIINIGAPENNFTIKEVAHLVVEAVKAFPKKWQKTETTKIISIPQEEYFNSSYEDVSHRVPKIEKAKTLLNWQPTTPLPKALEKTAAYYIEQIQSQSRETLQRKRGS